MSWDSHERHDSGRHDSHVFRHHTARHDDTPVEKVQVAFAEFSPFYMALLQKRPMFLGSLQIVATS